MITVRPSGQVAFAMGTDTSNAYGTGMLSNALGLEHASHGASRSTDNLLVYSSLSDAMLSKRGTRRQAPPPPLHLPARDYRAFGPTSPGSALTSSPGLEATHLGDYSSSLPPSPATVASPTYAGFPSPFAIPMPLASPSQVTRPVPISPAIGPDGQQKAAGTGPSSHRRKLSLHAARVATEVALSALSLDLDREEDEEEGRSPSGMNFRHSFEFDRSGFNPRSSPALGAVSPGLSEYGSGAELWSDGQGGLDSDDQPKRKGRARMSQEKRRRLARRREREAAMQEGSSPAAQHSVPHSAPPHIGSFDQARVSPSLSSVGLQQTRSHQQEPQSARSWWPAQDFRAPSPSLGERWSPQLEQCRPSFGNSSFHSSPGSAHISFGPLDYDQHCSPTSPALSVSSFGSARCSSPFEQTFSNALRLSGHEELQSFHQHTFHRESAEEVRVATTQRTPGARERGPRPQLVLQPPTPQDAHLWGRGATIPREGVPAPSLLSSAKRLSQMITSPETIVEGREDAHYQVPVSSSSAPPIGLGSPLQH